MIIYGFKKFFPITLDLLKHSLDLDQNNATHLKKFENLSREIQNEKQLNNIDLLEVSKNYELISEDDLIPREKLEIFKYSDDLGPKLTNLFEEILNEKSMNKETNSNVKVKEK